MTLNIPTLPDPAYDAPAFDTRSDRYDLYSETWEDFTLLDDATARDWQRMHRWEREHFENAFSKPPIVVRDKPMIEVINYIPERGDGCGCITIASLQPHHREGSETEQMDILYMDGELTDADNWRLPETALRRRPIILARHGDHLIAARTAAELALGGERCGWIDVGRDLIEWEKRLLKFELIPLKRIY